MENIIEQKYTEKVNTQSDINQHLPWVATVAKECESICEMGVRTVVSSWALLFGLSLNKSKNKSLLCVDLDDCPIDELKSQCELIGVDFNFIKGDTVKIEIPEVDCLFIDTNHTYSHLMEEFRLHSDKVKKYMIIHDTGRFGPFGYKDCDQTHHDYINKVDYKVYDKEGMYPAVMDFVEQNEDWELTKHLDDLNGLTILNRKGVTSDE